MNVNDCETVHISLPEVVSSACEVIIPKQTIPGLLMSLVLMVLGVPGFAHVVIPEPQQPVDPSANIQLKQIDVETTIKNQVAVTYVTQVIENPTACRIEGEYLFPLPDNARLTDFTMTVNGEPVSGEVLDEEEARRIYERIVRRRKDPAFLRYVGQGALRVNVFPIEARQQRTLEIEYQQTLSSENGRTEYRLPLNMAENQPAPPEAVTVDVTIENSSELKMVRSPSHTIDVSREHSNRVSAHFSAENKAPTRDFRLFYSTGEDRFGIDSMTYRDGHGRIRNLAG